jgi:hypothetical protein
MRITLASLALLTAFTTSATAHAAPLFDLDTATPLTDGSTVPDQLILYTAATNGGLSEPYLGLDHSDGQYFTGDISDPAFAPSTYTLDRSYGTLGITTMPEPSPLILLGSGLLFVAGTLRWRSGRIDSRQAA